MTQPKKQRQKFKIQTAACKCDWKEIPWRRAETDDDADFAAKTRKMTQVQTTKNLWLVQYVEIIVSPNVPVSWDKFVLSVFEEETLAD